MVVFDCKYSNDGGSDALKNGDGEAGCYSDGSCWKLLLSSGRH